MFAASSAPVSLYLNRVSRVEKHTLHLLLGELRVASSAVEVVGTRADGGETTESSKSASGHCCRWKSVESYENLCVCDGGV